MASFCESLLEHATFEFDRHMVVAYGMVNEAGGRASVLNFGSPEQAAAFAEEFLSGRDFVVIRNESQLLCLAGLDAVMDTADNNQRIRPRTYCRDALTGTVRHLH